MNAARTLDPAKSSRLTRAIIRRTRGQAHGPLTFDEPVRLRRDPEAQCFPRREATGAREPVKPVIEITAKVAGNSILVVGGACPQTRSKQAQVWERRKSRRVLAVLYDPNEFFVR